MIRNLIFYCYPVRGSVWSWHVPRLLERLEVWNGRRLLVVAIDERTENLSTVFDTFARLDAEVLVRENDPKLGETAHFIDTLGLLESEREDEATFYAHAKGVTRKGAYLEPVLNWSRLMYDANLSRPALVDRKLAESPAVGCLRWEHEPPRRGWCFAGTFFWLRHSALFTRDWRRIDRGFYGVEDYPGAQFEKKESYCLGGSGTTPENLYAGCVDTAFSDRILKAIDEEERQCTKAS